MKVVYLDHAATTPVHPAVVEAMYPYYIEHFGNPSSIHHFGRKAQQALSYAREQIARYIHANPAEIVFTSGGTESNNMAIHSVIQAARKQQLSCHVITTTIEHHAVLAPLHIWQQANVEVTYVPVDSTGYVNIEDIEKAIQPNTVLISVMYGNNEVGTIQPIAAIGEMARRRGIVFHVDAVQALGKVRLDLSQCPVDLMSFSAHKINGPKGIGALYVSSKIKLTPLLLGGSQEKKRRAGTENIAGIVGFAKAIELTAQHFESQVSIIKYHKQLMTNLFAQHLHKEEYALNGHQHHTLPHIINISFLGVPTESMLMNLDLAGVAVSSGSACTSGSLEISHVLKAMHLPEAILHSAIRFSFGYGNQDEDIHHAVDCVVKVVQRIRNKP